MVPITVVSPPRSAPKLSGIRRREGALYLFERASGAWSQQTKLSGTESAAFNRFAYSVALAGDVLVTGAPLAVKVGKLNPGAAYVYERQGPPTLYLPLIRH